MVEQGFDVVVVGAGNAALAARESGASVAVLCIRAKGVRFVPMYGRQAFKVGAMPCGLFCLDYPGGTGLAAGRGAAG